MTLSHRSLIVRLTVAVMLAIGVTVPSALRLVVASAADKPRAERPVYNVGDKWIRTDGIYVLVRIDKDVYVFSAGGGKEFHLTKNLGVSKIIVEGRPELDLEPPANLSWPLEVGKWGVTRALWRTPPPQPLANPGRGKVVPVTFPPGVARLATSPSRTVATAMMRSTLNLSFAQPRPPASRRPVGADPERISAR